MLGPLTGVILDGKIDNEFRISFKFPDGQKCATKLVDMQTIVERISTKLFYQICCKEFGARPVCEYESDFIRDCFRTITEKQFAMLNIDHHPLLKNLRLCKNHSDTDGFGLSIY
jgi:hypothetical protein